MKLLIPAAFAASFLLSAQPPASEPAFDVASLRPSQGVITTQTFRSTPGTLTIENFDMMQLLAWAYNLQESQIQGPDWFKETRFTLAAKAADPADDDRLRLMLRRLLAERFKMKSHHELRDIPTFELTLAKGGPRFHESSTKDASKFIESSTTGDPQFSKDRTGLIAERVTIPQFAEKLSEPLQRPVVDKTGLKGRYDFRIDTTAYLNQSAGDGGGSGQIDPLALIFNALQGQLGVKVEAGKDKVDLLVVDAVDKVPTEN